MSLSDLNILKSKLEELESKIGQSAEEIGKREKQSKKVEDVFVNEFLPKQQNKVTFNVAGTIYTTTEASINQHKNTLFNEIINPQNGICFRDEIFIDRCPKIFSYIIHFIRHKRLNLDKNDAKLLYKIRLEADYFEIWELVKMIDDLEQDVSLVSYSFTGPYKYKDKIIGSNDIKHLGDSDLSKGLCCTNPATIVFELSKKCVIKTLHIGALVVGDEWYYENGKGAIILSSIDGKEFTEIGVISKLEKTISTIELNKKIEGRYLKFQNSGFLGFGYLKVIEED